MNIRLNETNRTLLSLYGPAIVMSLGQGMVAPTIPALATTFDVSAGLAAQLVTAGMLGRVSASIPIGQILDRYGRRPVLIGGPLLVALASALTAIAPIFPLLLVAQFLAGIGSNGWIVAREITVVDLVKPEQRGRMISSFHGMSSVGVAIGPVLGGIVTDAVGFRSVFWVYALLSLITLAVSFGIKETGKKQTGPTRLLNIGKLSEVEPRYRTTYVVLVFNTFVAMMRGTLITTLIPLYVGLQLGFSSTEIGTWFGIYGLANVLMIAPTGMMLDARGRKAVVIPSTIIATFVFLCFPFATLTWQLGLLAVATGVSSGLALGSMATYTYDVIPEHARGRLQSLRRLFGDGGAIIGPAVAGVITNTAGASAAFFAFLPLQIVAAIAIIFFATESLKRVEGRAKVGGAG